MCGFCGYVDLTNDITNEKIIKEMSKTLIKNISNANNIFIDNNTAFAYARKSQIDIDDSYQPMSKLANGNIYTAVCMGELYNKDELKISLSKLGYIFETTYDLEVILVSYIEYGINCLKYLDGIFSFVIYDMNNKSLFLGRDKLGVKPLYFTNVNGIEPKFIFSTQIKSILAHPDVRPVMDKNGLMELIGLGPAHTPGKTYFKDILELEAGHMAIFKDGNLMVDKYWDLESKECLDSEEDAIEKIHDLVVNSTKKQLSSDSNICSMLSGGLDSSILSKIAHDNIQNLTTFSIDYVGNDKNFVSNDYQMTKDSDYVKIMKNYLNTNHKTILIDNTTLFELLDEALAARDMPGMVDIDTSMYAFCKSITEAGFKISLSGECSDEIFGGYPWYYKENLVNHDGFPWALSENLRENVIKKGILEKDELRNYVDNARKDTLKNVVHLNENDEIENKFRETNYLTIKWFMNTLIERTDKIANINSLKVRIPFADYRIFEYVYNLPAMMKLGLSKSNLPVEKYLLRKAFKDELPEDVVYRKKSPFPKTYDPIYLNLVENRIKSILEDKNSRLLEIIDKEYVQSILAVHGENLTENWFGQLMTYPQTLAYLIQIDSWLKKYNISIEL